MKENMKMMSRMMMRKIMPKEMILVNTMTMMITKITKNTLMMTMIKMKTVTILMLTSTITDGKRDSHKIIMMMVMVMVMVMMSVMAITMMTMRINLMVINITVMTKGPGGGCLLTSEDRPQTRRRPYCACCRD